jgi:hypothetical protein
MNAARVIIALVAILATLAMMPTPAFASAPENSPRPAPRPAAADATVTRLEQVLSTSGVLNSPRPTARPRDLPRSHTVRTTGIRTQPVPDTTVGRTGGLCGASDIVGVKLTPITARVQGCGIAEPVRVTAVGGVALSQPATIDCTTALALRSWVMEALIPTVGTRGGGVARIDVYASYVCRTRNNQKGARVSEHGRGRAIDIGGITLKNGSVIPVLSGWRDETKGPILRQLHRAACGPFGTVLGPSSDKFHQNHFHFDTARHRNGPFCR